MGIFDLFSGTKTQEAKKPPVPNMLFTPSFSGPGTSALGLKNAPAPLVGLKKPDTWAADATHSPEWPSMVAAAKASNDKRAFDTQLASDTESLRPLLKRSAQRQRGGIVEPESDDLDEITEEIISNARSVAKKNYLTADEIVKHNIPDIIGAPLLVAERISQAGEGAASSLYDIPGRIGEGLGFENNFLTRQTGQQQLAKYREFIEKYTPDRLAEFEEAVSQEGYSKGMELTGRTLETVAESVAVGSAVMRVTSSIPAMQKLANSGRWGRFLYTAINNVAADVGIRTEQAFKNKSTVDEVARGVMSSPSMLFAFHSVPALGVGILADLYAGKANGLSLENNLMNAAMNLGGNTLDLKNLRQVRRMGDLPLDDLKARFLETFNGPPKLAQEAWRQAEMTYAYAQANPQDMKGVMKMHVDGENRLLKLKADFDKATMKENRLVGLKGEGATGSPKPLPGSEDDIPLNKFDIEESNMVDAKAGPKWQRFKSDEGTPILTKNGLLYRAMPKAEFDDIVATGHFTPSAPEAPGMPGRKYFDADMDSARTFGELHEHGVGGSEVLVRVAEKNLPDVHADNHIPGSEQQALSVFTTKPMPSHGAEFSVDGGKTWKAIPQPETASSPSLLSPLAQKGAPRAATELQSTTKSSADTDQSGNLTTKSREWLEGDEAQKKTIPPDRTPYKERVATLDKAASPKNVLKRMGLGHRYTELRTAKNDARLELEGLQKKIQGWAKIAPGNEANIRIAKYLDGQTGRNTLKLEELAIVDEIRPILNAAAKDIGLKPGKGFLTEYFPHIFDSKSMRAELPEDIALRISQSDTPAGSTYNPFKQKRHGMEGYKEDTWTALDAYFRRYVRSKYMDPVLSNIRADSEKLTDSSQIAFIKKFIDQVNFRPTESDIAADNQIKKILSRVDELQTKMFGKKLIQMEGKMGPRPFHWLTKKARHAISRGAFWLNPATALRNLTQGVNTYKELGERYTLEGYAIFAKKWALRDFSELHREGILEGAISQIDQSKPALEKVWDTADKVGFSFMRWTEFINRAPAYYGAKAKAMAGKIKGVPKGNERAAIEYAKDIVENTQFRFDELGMPVGLGSDMAKTALQFQPYTIKQTEFLGGDVLKGNALGLTRYAVGSTVILLTVGKALGLDWKSFLPGARILEEGGYIPPVLQPVIALAQAALGVEERKRVTTVEKSLRLLIPGGVQGAKMLQADKMRREGMVKSRSGKTRLYNAPEDGEFMEWIRAYLMGPGNTTKGQEYYNKGKFDMGEALGDMFKTKQPYVPGDSDLPSLDSMPALPELPALPAFE